MIVTLTANAEGHQRLYLGGTASIELWLEKASNGYHWALHTADGLGGNHLSDDDKRSVAAHRLWKLCQLLNCTTEDLPHVPWSVLVSLHAANPRESRRMATPRRNIAEHCYVATAPNMRRPRADFRAEDFAQFKRQR